VDVLLHRRKNIGRRLKIVREMTDEKVMERVRVMNMMGVNFDCGDDDDD
jgi:hypothetical protein